MKKKIKNLVLPTLCFFLFCLCIYLMITRNSITVKKVDLEELFQDFNGYDSPERTMTFTIDLPKECRLKGTYKGKVFRQIDASKGDTCEEYRYTNGEDPDKYTDKMVSKDVVYNIRRKLKQNCREINDNNYMYKNSPERLSNICNNKDYCNWKGGVDPEKDVDDNGVPTGECIFDKNFIKNI